MKLKMAVFHNVAFSSLMKNMAKSICASAAQSAACWRHHRRLLPKCRNIYEGALVNRANEGPASGVRWKRMKAALRLVNSDLSIARSVYLE